MTHFTDSLINEYLTEDENNQEFNIDKAAAAEFYNALKSSKPYIDAEAFHKAYDDLFKNLNISHIFVMVGPKEGLISNKSDYKYIKDCKNSYASNVLKKLWAAQFVDHLRSKKELEQFKKDAEEKELQKIEYENATEALRAECTKKANEVIMLAADKLDKDLVEKFLKIVGKDNISDILELTPKIKADDNFKKPATCEGYRLGFNVDDFGWGYDFGTRIEADECAHYWDKLLAKFCDMHNSQVINDNLTKDFAIYNKLDCDTLYFIDENDEIYTIDKEEDKNKSSWDRKVKNLVIKKNNKAEDKYSIKKWQKLNTEEYPNTASFKLIVAHELISRHKSNAYLSEDWIVYYDPTIDKAIGKECGVSYAEYNGGNCETTIKLMSTGEIPAEFKAVGLTAAEKHYYECDSGD